MTAVALAVTDASASGAGARPEATAEFSLRLRLGEERADGAALLAELAQAILSLVSERAPQLEVHSALIPGADGPGGEDVTAPSATERAHAAWRTPPASRQTLRVDPA